MQYLVIFNEVPEGIKVFHFSEVSKEDAIKLEACNDKYINSDAWPEERWLMKFLNTPLKHPMRVSGDMRIIETGFVM